MALTKRNKDTVLRDYYDNTIQLGLFLSYGPTQFGDFELRLDAVRVLIPQGGSPVSIQGISSSYAYEDLHEFADFRIRCTVRALFASDENVTPGHDVEYQTYRIDNAEQAMDMGRVLKKIHDGIEKIKDKQGPTSSFGWYVKRVCNIIGVDWICWNNGDGKIRSYDDVDLVLSSPSAVVSKIDSILVDFAAEMGKPLAKMAY